jgi:hypothetical protein
MGGSNRRPAHVFYTRQATGNTCKGKILLKFFGLTGADDPVLDAPTRPTEL